MSSPLAVSVLAVLLTAAVTVAVYALAKRDAARAAEAKANAALASRLSELLTVQAIGRELPAASDPERVAAIVERECRKLFEVDSFFLGLCDGDSGELVHPPPADALGGPLASWIVHAKRALRIDDAAVAPSGPTARPPAAPGAAGSILAAPLLIGERAVGLVAVHAASSGAYDDHQLAVLLTIAQQAAIAMDHAQRDASASMDPVTGLYVRDVLVRRFEDEYVRAKRYGGTFSILMLDLDDFRTVTERRGRRAGDRYLRALGAVIRSRMRTADVGCRYGGDELCILLPETDLSGAGPLAERLRADVARLVVDVDGAPVRTTVSIGIASFPAHDAGTVRGLLLRADQALYKAKLAGRNRVEPFAA